MYSPTIIDRFTDFYTDQTKHKLVRYEIDFVDTMIERLNKKLDKDSGKQLIPFTPEETRFISNERVLSKLDFRYWCERYCWLIQNDGILGRLKVWESQRILLDRYLAKMEVAMWAARDNDEPTDGMLLVLHKARQLGASMFAQAILMHRLNFTPNLRGLMASIDDEKTQILFARADRIYERMPYWMRAEVKYHVKDRGFMWSKLDSVYAMQDARQEAGIGQGESWDVSHITECGKFDKRATHSLENDFFPTLPQSIRTICILESTAQGRGNWWHRWTEQVRKGQAKAWTYAFIPWYIEKDKYRRTPPEGWEPSPLSMAHAHKVYQTSAAFLGYSVMLPADQLYWYETSRLTAQNSGTLHLFLANYCATPDESFQHSKRSAFSTELLEQLRLDTDAGSPHLVQVR